MARFRGLQKACVMVVFARAFPTSLDCLIPISLSEVSLRLGWCAVRNTELALDDSLSLIVSISIKYLTSGVTFSCVSP